MMTATTNYVIGDTYDVDVFYMQLMDGEWDWGLVDVYLNKEWSAKHGDGMQMNVQNEIACISSNEKIQVHDLV